MLPVAGKPFMGVDCTVWNMKILRESAFAKQGFHEFLEFVIFHGTEIDCVLVVASCSW